MATTLDRLAGGPISWGVCEVPGWGAELPYERVFREMRSLGITATEAGPVGYLGHDAAEVSSTLAAAGMRLVGAFLPVVLHDPAALEGTLDSARETAGMLAATGASKLISAAVVDLDWSPRVSLDDAAWLHVFDALERIDEIAAAAGLEHVLHPHANTIVELDEDVARVLAGSGVRLCLDTGHLALGGTDVVALAEDHGGRVGHVHLKDVHLDVADRFRRGELDLVEATRQGLFCALGDGDVAVERVIRALEAGGYEGWYVLEQDITLASGAIPEGTGPVEDVRRSVVFLQQCLNG
jgi:inosose dehydratase